MRNAASHGSNLSQARLIRNHAPTFLRAPARARRIAQRDEQRLGGEREPRRQLPAGDMAERILDDEAALALEGKVEV